TAGDIHTEHLKLPLTTGGNGNGNKTARVSGGNGDGQSMDPAAAIAPHDAPQTVLEYIAAPAPSPERQSRHRLQHQIRAARLKGYEGDMCGECGQFTMVRNGTCLKCDTCGATSGCS
ncbi:MAG TPA: hypothetical protein VN285_07050, partial [Candidatus Deferrimicrobium sp.]|nr:hypothetical protein [Candidatus Deferrimicrobium sp.]